MSALFNFDKNKLERIEDNVFAIGSIIGQILLPIGGIMLILLPFVMDIIFNYDDGFFAIFYFLFIIICGVFGAGATASAGLDNNTIWHRLNRKLKVFGYK